jgi:hypothetical protein
MKAFLLRLYPRRWRQRYGHELARLLDDLGPLRPRHAIDLLRGASDAHLEAIMGSPVRMALRRATAVAAVAWLVLSVGIVLSNVVFPSPTDDNDGPLVLASYLGVFVALVVVGRLAGQVTTSPRVHVLAGTVAGALIGAFTAGTFFAMDNIFLSIVSQQQSHITGFAESGMSSMRDYLNHTLVGALVFWTILFGVLGAGLAAAGGATVRRPATPQP